MKHDEISLRTKETMAASLKRLACQKPFSKIRVSDIIADCSINRNTFYYHFEDIYDLLRWTLDHDAIEIARQFDFLAENDELVDFVMDYIEQNNAFLRSIYYSLGQLELKRFFYSSMRSISAQAVNEVKAQLNLSVTEEFKEFIINFYTEAIAASLLSVIDQPTKLSRERLTSYTAILKDTMIQSALKAASEAGL